MRVIDSANKQVVSLLHIQLIIIQICTSAFQKSQFFFSHDLNVETEI